jgi:hypothetical protein
VDAYEKEYVEAVEANEGSGEEDEGGGGSGGGGGPAIWAAREKLVDLWLTMRQDGRFRNALLNTRHEVRRAREKSNELGRQAKKLRQWWQTAYDAMADLQNAMADGMSSVRVNKVPSWNDEISYEQRVRELRAVADAATGRTYEVKPAPEGPPGGGDD